MQFSKYIHYTKLLQVNSKSFSLREMIDASSHDALPVVEKDRSWQEDKEALLEAGKLRNLDRNTQTYSVMIYYTLDFVRIQPNVRGKRATYSVNPKLQST